MIPPRRTRDQGLQMTPSLPQPLPPTIDHPAIHPKGLPRRPLPITLVEPHDPHPLPRNLTTRITPQTDQHIPTPPVQGQSAEDRICSHEITRPCQPLTPLSNPPPPSSPMSHMYLNFFSATRRRWGERFRKGSFVAARGCARARRRSPPSACHLPVAGCLKELLEPVPRGSMSPGGRSGEGRDRGEAASGRPEKPGAETAPARLQRHATMSHLPHRDEDHRCDHRG